MRLTAAIECSRALLRVSKDSFGMMEIVESVDLGEIDPGGITQMSRAPLMPRHVERISIGRGILC